MLDINGLFCTDLQMFIPCAFYVLRIKKLKKNTQIVKILNSVNVMPKKKKTFLFAVPYNEVYSTDTLPTEIFKFIC